MGKCQTFLWGWAGMGTFLKVIGTGWRRGRRECMGTVGMGTYICPRAVLYPGSLLPRAIKQIIIIMLTLRAPSLAYDRQRRRFACRHSQSTIIFNNQSIINQ